jgi:enolase
MEHLIKANLGANAIGVSPAAKAAANELNQPYINT